jgi:hypothetical protein
LENWRNLQKQMKAVVGAGVVVRRTAKVIKPANVKILE